MITEIAQCSHQFHLAIVSRSTASHMRWLHYITAQIVCIFSYRAQLREAIFAFQEQDIDFRHELELLENELLDSKKNELR
jgi:hypothetical protein